MSEAEEQANGVAAPIKVTAEQLGIVQGCVRRVAYA